VRPGVGQLSPLLDKIENVAFQALSQILAQPGEIERYLRHRPGSRFVRAFSRLFGGTHKRLQSLIDRRSIGDLAANRIA